MPKFNINYALLARPYAKAAFDFSMQKKSIKQWEEMLTLVTNVLNSEQLNIIKLEVLEPFIASKILIKICKENIDNHFCNFIKIIAVNKRFFLFATILTLFHEYKDIYNNIINIKVYSPIKLNKQEQLNLNKLFQQKFLKKINLTHKIDKSLIYGTKFQFKDIIVEKSINTYLQMLKKFLRK